MKDFDAPFPIVKDEIRSRDNALGVLLRTKRVFGTLMGMFVGTSVETFVGLLVG